MPINPTIHIAPSPITLVILVTHMVLMLISLIILGTLMVPILIRCNNPFRFIKYMWLVLNDSQSQSINIKLLL